MAFSDWLALGIIGLIIKKQIARSERTKLLREQEYEEYEEERRKQEIELNRQKEVDAKRMRTPCNFDEGIAHEEFLTIVRSVGKSIKRIKKVTTSGPVVYCTVESQSGHSEWDFNVDFNDWGHVTGTYWKSTENHDSNIPDVFGEIVSDRICRLLRERNINFPDFSNYVNDNKTLETSSGLSWCRRTGVVKKIFSLEKPITIRFDSCNLVGKHIYPVVSILKNTASKM